jgi:hypothetical protein
LHAKTIGLPLNRHVTLHLESAGVHDNVAAVVIGRFLALARDWLRKRGMRTAWVWVRENGDGKGSHVHILLHVPRAAPWASWRMIRWFKLATGQPYSTGAMNSERIGGTANASVSAPEHYQANLAAVVGYLLKGASPDAVHALRLERLEPGGTVIGKRAGWSENIGQAARAAFAKTAMDSQGAGSSLGL